MKSLRDLLEKHNNLVHWKLILNLVLCNTTVVAMEMLDYEVKALCK